MRVARNTRNTRNTRATWTTCAVAAATTAALLASTACSSDDKDDAAGPAAATASGPSDAPGPAQPGGPAQGAGVSGVPQPPGGGSANGASPGANDHPGTPGAAPCTPADLSVVATAEPRDGGRHIILTATNKSAKTCTLVHYPDVVFGDGSHEPVLPMESPAEEVATIAPGGKAYSGLLLSRVGEPVDAVTSMAVNLKNHDNDEPVGNPVDVALPQDLGGFLNIGDGLSVTFWNKDRDAVYKYTFAR
ncbi:DUF4232 domain-containing protein [Streptomycetaceae bacterium NBC_01309]